MNILPNMHKANNGLDSDLSQKDADFGKIAVRLKMITDKELRQCLEEIKGKPYTPLVLAKIMVQKGLLQVGQIQEIYRQMELHSNAPEPDPQKQDISAIKQPIQTFERYQLLEKLGESGMSVVFKAYDPKLSRTVALKKNKSVSRLARKMFLSGARATASLQHPNIVKVYEFGEAEGQLFFTMEYIEGVPLNKINRKLWAFSKIIKLMMEICHPMEHSHAQGVLHRNLKPSNILVLQNGIPKITDFGLASLLDESLDMSGTVDVSRAGNISEKENLSQSLPYMACEQAQGKLHQIDIRTDVYSLGCILYELLVGHPPFVAKKSEELLDKILHEKPLPPSQIKQALAAYSIDDVCLKALNKERDSRYQNVRDFRKDMEKILDRLSTGTDFGQKIRNIAHIAASLLRSFFPKFIKNKK